MSFRIRRELLGKLRRLPLGWFTDRNSGVVKKTVEDDVAALHQLIAHSVVEVTAAAGPVVVAVGYLLAVDWRMALISLVPLVAGLVVHQRAMAGAGTKYPEFMAWLTRLSGAAVEFVNGIGVVKAFGTPGVASRRSQPRRPILRPPPAAAAAPGVARRRGISGSGPHRGDDGASSASAVRACAS
ncbi:ABC transporter ATP-binding protein [Nonomuraea sp. PA05]|uniref:ABC transporter transmembrane domain-containing protein n=1 Tax=Nonomuraea sp. PA05 TaxID=2604466 RepID=UPI0011D9EB87|nr:ABC transporter transmembrane domain-containing protein [Nonomuraea sp. PA05]TYB56996.1 ABC transporter ATP-binding protein [Nonomuraea sp. PA05]